MYNYSTDYERLWELVKAGNEPVCSYDVYDIFNKKAREWGNAKIMWEENKKDFVKGCKDFNLRWIDPQPVEGVRLSKEQFEIYQNEAFAAGQQSIIEKLKALQRWDIVPDEGSIGYSLLIGHKGKVIEAADIETIINSTQS